jgi:hypothetical protein
MKISKQKILLDLELMNLGLIPFSANLAQTIEGWPDDRKKKLFRKFRKIARKAAHQTAIRECRMYGSGSHKEQLRWIAARTQYLFNPPSPKYLGGGSPCLTGKSLQTYRYKKRKSVIENWLRREIWRRISHEDYA